MKRVILCVMCAVIATGAFAQEQGKVRGGLDLGGCFPNGGGGGLCLDVPIGYNLQDNMNVGIKVGVAVMAKLDPFGETADAAANLNFMATYAYYFNSGKSPVAPFLGAGAGLYSVAAGSAGVNTVAVEAGNRFGGMLSAGVELGKFRVALQYNLVPSSAVRMTGTGTGTELSKDKIKNSYLGLTIGFFAGGGKWKK